MRAYIAGRRRKKNRRDANAKKKLFLAEMRKVRSKAVVQMNTRRLEWLRVLTRLAKIYKNFCTLVRLSSWKMSLVFTWLIVKAVMLARPLKTSVRKVRYRSYSPEESVSERSKVREK